MWSLEEKICRCLVFTKIHAFCSLTLGELICFFCLWWGQVVGNLVDSVGGLLGLGLPFWVWFYRESTGCPSGCWLCSKCLLWDRYRSHIFCCISWQEIVCDGWQFEDNCIPVSSHTPDPGKKSMLVQLPLSDLVELILSEIFHLGVLGI